METKTMYNVLSPYIAQYLISMAKQLRMFRNTFGQIKAEH